MILHFKLFPSALGMGPVAGGVETEGECVGARAVM